MQREIYSHRTFRRILMFGMILVTLLVVVPIILGAFVCLVIGLATNPISGAIAAAYWIYFILLAVPIAFQICLIFYGSIGLLERRYDQTWKKVLRVLAFVFFGCMTAAAVLFFFWWRKLWGIHDDVGGIILFILLWGGSLLHLALEVGLRLSSRKKHLRRGRM